MEARQIAYDVQLIEYEGWEADRDQAEHDAQPDVWE